LKIFPLHIDCISRTLTEKLACYGENLKIEFPSGAQWFPEEKKDETKKAGMLYFEDLIVTGKNRKKVKGNRHPGTTISPGSHKLRPYSRKI